MRARSTLTALAATTAVLAVAPGPAQAAKSCGTTKAQFGGKGKTYKLSVRVHRGSIGCSTAKSIVKRGFFSMRGYSGWRCSEARPATTYNIVCAPNGQDPDTAKRVVRAKIV